MPWTTPNPDAVAAEDRRLRYELLKLLHAERINPCGGWVTARYALDIVSMPMTIADRPPSEDRVMGLLTDLVDKGLAIFEDNRNERGQVYGVDYATYKITGNGTSFVLRSRPADADIDDGRIVR